MVLEEDFNHVDQGGPVYIDRLAQTYFGPNKLARLNPS